MSDPDREWELVPNAGDASIPPSPSNACCDVSDDPPTATAPDAVAPPSEETSASSPALALAPAPVPASDGVAEEDNIIDVATPAAAAAAAADTAAASTDASAGAGARAKDLNAARAEIRRTMEAAAGQMRTAIDRLRGAAPLDDPSSSSSSSEDEDNDNDNEEEEGAGDGSDRGQATQSSDRGTHSAHGAEGTHEKKKKTRKLQLPSDSAPPYPPFACYVTPSPNDPLLCIAPYYPSEAPSPSAAVGDTSNTNARLPAGGSDKAGALCKGPCKGEPLWTAVTPDHHVIKRVLTPAAPNAAPVQALSRVTFTMIARYYPPFTKEDAKAVKTAQKSAATAVSPSTTTENDASVVTPAVLSLPPPSHAVEFASSAPPDAVDVMLGHAQAARGLEIALATMRVGEKALVRCSPTFGYSATRRPEEVPLAAPLEFEVEVTHVEKEPNPQSLDADGRLAWAESRRPLARALLAEGRPQAALRQYQRALTLLEHESVRNTRGAAHRALAATLLVNQAVVNAKLSRDDVVIALCTDALALVAAQGHVKARAVRGAALGRVGRLEDAEADLKVAEAALGGAVEKEEEAGRLKEAADKAQNELDKAVGGTTVAAAQQTLTAALAAHATASAAASAAAAAVGVGGGSPKQLLVSVRVSLARVRAKAAGEHKRLKAKVDALRAPPSSGTTAGAGGKAGAGTGTGLGLPGADGLPVGLYDDKPLKAPVDPLHRRPVADLRAKNAWEGAWNLAKFVGGLAKERLMEWCCGSNKKKNKNNA